jgi:Arc/MetJ-type ribon-helix-helix transcriptional regulator
MRQMPRKPAGAAHGKKIGVSVTMDPALYEWVKARSSPGGQFASLSHAVERGLALLREHEEGKWVLAKK